MYVKYRAWGNIGSIMDHKALPKDNLIQQDPNKILDINCLPFKAILKALNRHVVFILQTFILPVVNILKT